MINIANGRDIQPTAICSSNNSKLQRVIKIVTYDGNSLLNIWEEFVGYIFTKDGCFVTTKDNFVVKCKDQ